MRSKTRVDGLKQEIKTLLIVVSATLASGQMYRVSTINFTGTPLYSADEFAKNTKLHPGDVASRDMP